MSDLSADLNPASNLSPDTVTCLLSWDAAKLLWDPWESEPIPAYGRFFKRCVDLMIAIPSLILLAPVFAITAIAIKLDSKGPVFYNSIRVGLRGRRFVCRKFRSMILNADELKERLRKHNQRRGPTFKIADDPRITPFGRFLRRYSLDELPQLVNVIVGDMSIVGPRPHPLDDVARYRPEHLRRCAVKPGLTGLWQIRARQSPSFELNMKLDQMYIRGWSLLFDLRIILETFAVVCRGDGQ
jgi:lipopolysaccharide/colanic/teichoic acid biosynthesis glycosyltransferase